MSDFIKQYWGECLSVIAVVVSVMGVVVATVQNRKLHNENKSLSVKPCLEVQLLFDSRICGRIIKCKDAIDEFNIWESKYTEYYTNHDLCLNGNTQGLFTVIVKNSGNGLAKNIIYSKISIKTNDAVFEFESNEILFFCSENEIKANKILSDIKPEDILKVSMTVSYQDMLNKTYIEKFIFAPINFKISEMKLISNEVVV